MLPDPTVNVINLALHITLSGCVYVCVLYICVPKVYLHLPHVHPCPDEVRGRVVPEGMGMHLRYLCRCVRFLDMLPHCSCSHPAVVCSP